MKAIKYTGELLKFYLDGAEDSILTPFDIRHRIYSRGEQVINFATIEGIEDFLFIMLFTTDGKTWHGSYQYKDGSKIVKMSLSSVSVILKNDLLSVRANWPFEDGVWEMFLENAVKESEFDGPDEDLPFEKALQHTLQ